MTLTDAVKLTLIDQAMQPGARTIHLTTLTAKVRTSRTPVREALLHLEAVGLWEVRPYCGAVPHFGGVADVRVRGAVLSGALAHGVEPVGEGIDVAIASSVMGGWGATAWEVLAAWPRNAHHWGIDLIKDQAAIEAAARDLQSALRSGLQSRAAEALDEWVRLVT